MRKFLFIIILLVCLLNSISFADVVYPTGVTFVVGSIFILTNYFFIIIFVGLIIYWGSVIINSIKNQEDDEHKEKRKVFFRKYRKCIFIIAVLVLTAYACWFTYEQLNKPISYYDSQEYKEIVEYNTGKSKAEILLGEPFDSMTDNELINEIGLDFEDKNILEFRYENELYKYHILDDGSKLILDNKDEITNLLVPAEIPVHFVGDFSGKVKSMKHQYLIDDEGSLYVGDVSNRVNMYNDYTPKKYEYMFKKISDDVKYNAICNLQFSKLKMGNCFNNYSFFATHLFYNNSYNDVLFLKNKDDIIQYLDSFDNFVDLDNKYTKKILLHKLFYGVYQLVDVSGNESGTDKEYISIEFNHFDLLDSGWRNNRNRYYVIDYNLKQLLPTKEITNKKYYEELNYPFNEKISDEELERLIPKNWFVEANYSLDKDVSYIQVKFEDNTINTYKKIEDYEKVLSILQKTGIEDYVESLFYIIY